MYSIIKLYKMYTSREHMPTRFALAIHGGTKDFKRLFQLWFARGDFAVYKREDQYGRMAIVSIFATSKKCYRVMFGTDMRKYGEDYRTMVQYHSFRTQEQLCLWLDTLKDKHTLVLEDKDEGESEDEE